MNSIDRTRLEIHTRYWRDWGTNPSWGAWHPLKPKIYYTYEEGNTDPTIKMMKARIEKVKKQDAKQLYFYKAEYKIVKVREIQITEDIELV